MSSVQWVSDFFPRGKLARVRGWQPTTSSAEAKRRVELYLYHLWAFMGCFRLNLTFNYISEAICATFCLSSWEKTLRKPDRFKFEYVWVHHHRYVLFIIKQGSFQFKHNYLILLPLFKLTACFGLCIRPSSGRKIYNCGDYTVWIINKIMWTIK